MRRFGKMQEGKRPLPSQPTGNRLWKSSNVFANYPPYTPSETWMQFQPKGFRTSSPGRQIVHRVVLHSPTCGIRRRILPFAIGTPPPGFRSQRCHRHICPRSVCVFGGRSSLTLGGNVMSIDWAPLVPFTSTEAGTNSVAISAADFFAARSFRPNTPDRDSHTASSRAQYWSRPIVPAIFSAIDGVVAPAS
jgi:hypothetical protein